MQCVLGLKRNDQNTSTRLSGGGAMHHFDVITPKLITSKINDDSARMTPDVISCNGDPGYGTSQNKTNNPQQFSNENTVTKMYPVNGQCSFYRFNLKY